MAEDFLKLALQTAERHIEQEEQPRGKEIYKAEPEALSFCVSESHARSEFTNIFL